MAVTTTTKWAVLAAKPGPRPGGVVWVAKSGGDFTSVKAALASIKDNSAAHRYVVKVAPGTYNETGGIDLKNYVDIEGSGQDVTTITCACGGLASPAFGGSSATLRAKGPNLHSEVRQLTVANTGPSTYSVGIWTGSVAVDTLTFVGITALASGGIGDYSIWNQESSPTLRNIVATSTGNGTTSTESFAVTIANSSYATHLGWAMDHVAAKAKGALVTIGIRVTQGFGTPRFTGVDASAEGVDAPTALSTGMYLIDANVLMDGSSSSSIRFNGAATSWGVDVTGVSIIQATDSSIGGFSAAINTLPSATSQISRSTISGGTYGTGTYRCAYNVDSNGLAVAC